ncbi:MAG: nitroreductase family protein [Bacteroidaceae bacterium]|nr:nitroreductase family protein [Bacteroidaceae bacterium]
MKSITDRRTIRKYSKEDVSTDLLSDLIQKASRAATMGNMQLYSVVVTRSAEQKEKLSPFHFNQKMVKEAPVVLTFCVDFNRFSEWCKFREANPGYNNFLSFLNSMSDTLLFTQNFCVLAEEKGLGTCYLGTTLYNPMGIIETLNLPKLTFPVATITLGWPDENPDQQDRLPLSAYMHEEFYSPYSKEKIDDIYSYKESLEENINFVNINNKKTLAQVFTDCRYTKEANESMSEEVLRVLKIQDFL